MGMTTTDRKAGDKPKKAKGTDAMRPHVRKAFEEVYERNKEAMRRLAKL